MCVRVCVCERVEKQPNFPLDADIPEKHGSQIPICTHNKTHPECVFENVTLSRGTGSFFGLVALISPQKSQSAGRRGE